MPVETLEKDRRKMLKPGVWLLYSTALFGMILVPVSTAALYILKLFPKLFQLKNEYSVVAGIGLGLVLSLIAGYLYSNMARKHVE